MFFTFVLASVLAFSTVLGRSSGPIPLQVTYTKEDQTIVQSNETGQIIAVDDRSSNLKYVMAIQSSGIWSEIKQRSLTINSQQRLDDKTAAKSPSDLTDEELAQLKQACHDGLKCVAVDQLLVLKQVKEPLGDSKVTVRTAITKITQVLTQYTTEYHEDVYQYETVQQSDDQSKVYESVTTIVEDNKELCQIDVTPATGESHRTNNDGNQKVVNNGTINYNITENYNINNGTINSATITKEPSDIITVAESPESRTRTDNVSDPSLLIVIAPRSEADNGDRLIKKRSLDDHPPTERTATTGTATNGLTVDESVTNAPKNDGDGHKLPRPSHTQGNVTSDRQYEPVTTINDHRKSVGQQLMITDGPSPRDRIVSGDGSGTRTDNSGRERKAQRSHPEITDRSDDSANAYKPDTNNSIVLNRSNRSNANRGNASADMKADQKLRDSGHPDRVENNSVDLKNGGENGQTGGDETDSIRDAVSAGSSNGASVQKGYVHDGTLNNGNMVQYNINNGTINSGNISNSNADGGIISVGTVNNGPVNYGTSNTYTNNGRQLSMSSYDVQQYLSSIDNMYSTIIERLGA